MKIIKVIFYGYSSTLNTNNIEPSTSSDNGQGTEKRKKLKLNERCPGFNDFVPLQPVKAQYKGHRNSRYLKLNAIILKSVVYKMLLMLYVVLINL